MSAQATVWSTRGVSLLSSARCREETCCCPPNATTTSCCTYVEHVCDAHGFEQVLARGCVVGAQVEEAADDRCGHAAFVLRRTGWQHDVTAYAAGFAPLILFECVLMCGCCGSCNSTGRVGERARHKRARGKGAVAARTEQQYQSVLERAQVLGRPCSMTGALYWYHRLHYCLPEGQPRLIWPQHDSRASKIIHSLFCNSHRDSAHTCCMPPLYTVSASS